MRPKEIPSDGSADVQEGMNIPQRRNKWESVKVELFTDDTILYAENPKEFTIKTIRTNNRVGKVARYKLNIQKSIVFLYASNEQGDATSPIRTAAMKRQTMTSIDQDVERLEPSPIAGGL